MMPGYGVAARQFRKLWPSEYPLVREHFLRLGTTSRYSRFGHAVSDPFIDSYCEMINVAHSVVYGAFLGGELRGVAELRLLYDTWPLEAELAFSVEDDCQDSGIGSELMSRVLMAAQNRSVATIYMICLRDNHRMRRIASKHEARLTLRADQIVGSLDPSVPDHRSLLGEWFDDTSGFMTYMLRL